MTTSKAPRAPQPQPQKKKAASKKASTSTKKKKKASTSKKKAATTKKKASTKAAAATKKAASKKTTASTKTTATKAVTCPPLPRSLGKDSPRRTAARAALLAVLFDADGRRVLPDDDALAAALTACGADDAWWACEANSYGPLYFLPTKQWISLFSQFVTELKIKSILEIGAGDGFLSTCIAHANPKLRVTATDSAAWAKPEARQNASDRKQFAGVAFAGIPIGADVSREGAVAAVERLRPHLVIAAWCPPGTLLERVIRAPSRLVLDISVDGDVCGNGEKTWRFEKDFLMGPLEDQALCRLDGDPRHARATRCTLYYGASHRRHAIERHKKVEVVFG